MQTFQINRLDLLWLWRLWWLSWVVCSIRLPKKIQDTYSVYETKFKELGNTAIGKEIKRCLEVISFHLSTLILHTKLEILLNQIYSCVTNPYLKSVHFHIWCQIYFYATKESHRLANKWTNIWMSHISLLH